MEGLLGLLFLPGCGVLFLSAWEVAGLFGEGCFLVLLLCSFMVLLVVSGSVQLHIECG